MHDSTANGRRLGRYTIHELVARGGMAAIYRAADGDGRPLAIKVLLAQLQRQPEFLERFRREAANAAALRHANIVPIYDSQTPEGGPPYLVMAWADGGSLADLLARQGGPLPPAQAAAILAQVAAALDYAHGQGVIHRDVKPSNILLMSDGRAMLADFGIAQSVQDTRLTADGAPVGTPAYMAPEQVRGQPPLSPQTDIYALGSVLHEMLTGQVPFQGDTTAVLYQHVHEPPPLLRSRNPSLPAALERIVQRAMAKSPRRRYASAGAMAADMQAALRPAPRRTVWPVLAVVAVLVLAELALASVIRPSPTPMSSRPPSASPSRAAIAPTTAKASPTAPPTVLPTAAPAPPLGLADPPDGQSFPTGSPVTLRWQAGEALPDGRRRVALRNEAGEMSFLPALPPQATEYTLADLAPGRYAWLVVTERPDGDTWREAGRSASRTFAILPPATPTRPAELVRAPSPPPAVGSRLSAPTLGTPAEQQTFHGRIAVVAFSWSEAARPLAGDEYYVLAIHHRKGDDFTWLKTNRYTIEDKRWLCEPDFGPELIWRVAIARQRAGSPNENPAGAEVSDYSQSRVFYWYP